MVDLAVHKYYGGNAGIAQALFRPNGGKGFQLRANIRRGIKYYPVALITGDGDGGLGACAGFKAALAQAVAIRAITIPLGKPPPAAEPSIRIFIGKGRGEEAAAVCTFRWRLRGARICVHFYGECRSLQAGKQLTE